MDLKGHFWQLQHQKKKTNKDKAARPNAHRPTTGQESFFSGSIVDFSGASVELSERLRKLGGSLQFQLSVCDYWVGLDWQVGRWREGKPSPASLFLLFVINRLIHSTGLTL